VPGEDIWLGRGEVRALPAADAELVEQGDVPVNVFVQAQSREEFDVAFRAVLDEQRLELVDLWSCGPLAEMLDIDEDVLDVLLLVGRDGPPQFVVFLSDEPEDAEDEDVELVRAAIGDGVGVNFRLVGDGDWVYGFPVAIGEEWALFHLVDRSAVALDGYAAIRLDELIDAETLTEDEDFVLRELARRGERPHDPSLPLDDHRSLLDAIAERYPLVMLFDEQRDGRRYIGRIDALTDDAVTVLGANVAGAWTTEHVHEYRGIVRIDFGQVYDQTLAIVLDG